ncbi:MAG: hypothetical protein Fur0022_41300 [Anaerolineales bacterium]
MNHTEFFQNLKANPHPVIVDLWAPWCMPCRAMTPLVKKMEKQYAGQVDVWKINADDSPDLLRALRVFGIPTMIVYQKGQEITRRTGALRESVLVDLFETAIRPGAVPLANLGMGERLLRVGTGMLLAGVGIVTSTWLLLLAGGAVAFTGLYDRCPIWKAVTGWIRGKLGKRSNSQAPKA